LSAGESATQFADDKIVHEFKAAEPESDRRRSVGNLTALPPDKLMRQLRLVEAIATCTLGLLLLQIGSAS